jgi:hypothetical protein
MEVLSFIIFIPEVKFQASLKNGAALNNYNPRPGQLQSVPNAS